LGLLVALGSIAGFIWSRTSGMPGMEVEEWLSPFGIVSMALEGVFILMFFLRPWRYQTDESLSPNAQKTLKYTLPSAGVLMLVLVSTFTYRWDAQLTSLYGQHVLSLDQALQSPVTSAREMEDKYGVQLSLAATSMMNSILDVRLKIIDPDKAQSLLKNQAAMLVDDQTLVLAPHMHAHIGNRLKAGKGYFLFFPTQQVIHTGTEVSLVIGDERFEPVFVR
jgi:hypothetical protein